MGLFRKPARERFADEVLAALKARVAAAWLDADEFAIRYQLDGTGEAHWMWLENSFQESRELSPAERSKYIHHRLGASLDDQPLPDTWDEIRPLLRSVIRGITMGQAGGGLHAPALPGSRVAAGRGDATSDGRGRVPLAVDLHRRARPNSCRLPRFQSRCGRHRQAFFDTHASPSQPLPIGERARRRW